MITPEHSSLTATILTGSVVLLVAFLLRILPHVLAPLGIGVDHWYWRQYIEKYRKDGGFPPDLPQYLLESDQWYPPFFPWLMALLPRALFDRYSHVFAIFIDLLRAIGVMVIMNSLTKNAMAVGVAGAVYALTPLLVLYNIQLNPRGLGALMLDVAATAVLLALYFNAPAWLWFVIVPSCGLLLLTHKMTTQLFWFLCLVCGVFWDWSLLALIPMSILVALGLSQGFYWKVLRHHWDIVSFWHRNWRWLGANPVKESPLYGDSAYETPRKLHRIGLMGVVKHLYTQLGYNPFAWLLLAILPLYPSFSIPIGGFLQYVAVWLGLTLVFALATSLVSPLRCLGAGHLYLYNAAYSASLLWGILFYWHVPHITAFLVVGTAASILGIGRFYLHIRQSATWKIDPDLESAMAFLSSRPKATVMCVPAMWYDVVAYKTGLPVLYGGHGYGFKMLEPTFPRLLISIRTLIARFDLRYLLLERDAVTEKFIADIPAHSARDFGKYRVISIDVAEK